MCISKKKIMVTRRRSWSVKQRTADRQLQKEKRNN